ncbi:MAG: hypothetical protein ACRD16_16055 [Thermoanaerobaculia bacterium]
MRFNARSLFPAIFAMVGLLAIAGCRRDATPREELKAQETDTSGSEKTVTKTEATTVGSTLVKETETTTHGAEGTGKNDTTTYLGTVSAYAPGRSIDVMTGENDHHHVDLTGKDTTVNVDPSVTVGNKVRLIETKDGHGHRTVDVSSAG